MTSKAIIIIIVLLGIFVSCKNNPMEIQEGYATVSNDLKINTLCLETKKDLNLFYSAICKDYCQQIYPKNEGSHYIKFACYNLDWYKDTFYIASEELNCTGLKGEKFTSVFLSFYNKSNSDILKSQDMNYIDMKEYMNDIYIETLK